MKSAAAPRRRSGDAGRTQANAAGKLYDNFIVYRAGRWSASLRDLRPLASLFALGAVALLALLVAAQAGLSFCSSRIAIGPAPMDDMAGMPGMAMGDGAGMMMMDHRMMVCPVVLVLIIASAALAAVAIGAWWLDPDRAGTGRTLARTLSRLPRLQTIAALCGFTALAVAAMLAVDGARVPGVWACALLALLVPAGASLAVIAATACGRIVLALGERLLVAIASAIAARNAGEGAPRRRRVSRTGAAVSCRERAAARGLRAPPSFVF